MGPNQGANKDPLEIMISLSLFKIIPVFSMTNLDPRFRASNHPDGGSSLGLDIILKVTTGKL